jgi:hypothetical protein
VNVCCICLADGVLEVNGAWYCIAHMHHGLHAVAETLALLTTPRMSTSADNLCEVFDDVLSDYDYPWPKDEQEEEDDDE